MSSPNTRTVGPLDPTDALPLPLKPGDLVAGRYEIVRFAGSGGSALVYAARDRKIRREVALKLLRPEKCSEIDLERSRREAEVGCLLDSERLVRMFDLFDSDGLVFLTMELVVGGSLRDVLRNGPLPVEDVIRFASEILEALEVLHGAGIVHRDLKPGNLLVTEAGHIKLSDFGIARKWSDDASRLTVTGMPIGTLAYLSPEQARGERVDPRSDLYSLGLVLFEMLTGRLPSVDSMVMRLDRRAAHLRTLRREVPRWLARTVARLLETKPEDRHQSAAEVLADVRRRRARDAWRWIRAATVTLVLAGGGLAAWMATRPPDDAQLVADGDWGMRVVDARGKTLWARQDTFPPFAAIVRRGAEREVAAVVGLSLHGLKGPTYGRILSFFDLRTGRLLRQQTLPSAAGSFADFSDHFGPAQVYATDLNGDGYDEVAVVYVHDYYPSFLVIDDLRRNDAHVVFVASGQHRVSQIVDVDGDGVKDIVLSGISNRMGWYNGLAAIRVPLDGTWDDFAAATPDRIDQPPSPSLLWYALVPPGPLSASDVGFDGKRGVFQLQYRTGPVLEMSVGSLMADAAARQAAYAHLRNSRHLALTAEPQAIVEAEEARAIADRIGDIWLGEWSKRLKGAAMIAAGRFAEADTFFDHLCNGCDAAGDISWDAANAFHLAGDLPRAVKWYRRVLGRDGRLWVGRMKYESLEGLVLALGEMGRWKDALAEIDAFIVADGGETGQGPWYQQYVKWRTGGQPELSYMEETTGDFQRYGALEMMLARGADPDAILKLVDREARRASFYTRPLLPLVRAEALRRAGRIDDALRAAREAFAALRIERRTNVLARGHFDLAAERLARLAETKGLIDEAKQVRADAAALGWHSKGGQ